MPTLNLTDRFVSGARSASRAVYFDTKARGLALRVTPSGSKTWAFVYRLGGKPQWLTLGTYPALSLASARTMATEKRHEVDVEHRDPAQERRAEKRVVEEPTPTTPAAAPAFTFTDLVRVYERFAKGRKRTWQNDIAKAEKYLIPAWGPLPVREITRAHVHELLDTLVSQGMTVGVNRIQAVISRLFTIALDRSLIDAHPAARMIKRFQERPSDRVLTDDELRALWQGLEQHPGAAADAVRLRLLLGQRGGEVDGMLWSEVDFEKAVWELPGARTKNARPHVVPLPSTALATLQRRRQEIPKSAPRVFPGLSAWTDDYRELTKIHGGTYTWKDLRRTVATRLAEHGFSEEVIGRVLNHARYTVTAKHYIKHSYLAEARRALEAWDAELAAVVSGQRAENGTVVLFQR
ncbi:MAG: integrase arm-type DNA-binding domain-containing protein [Vicinamibacterales bacterium]